MFKGLLVILLRFRFYPAPFYSDTVGILPVTSRVLEVLFVAVVKIDTGTAPVPVFHRGRCLFFPEIPVVVVIMAFMLIRVFSGGPQKSFGKNLAVHRNSCRGRGLPYYADNGNQQEETCNT